MVKEAESILKTFWVSLVGNYLPNSDAEKDFGERVQTYIDGQKWIRRPLTISPAICSQYGWKCVSTDLLECVSCCAQLPVYYPGIEQYDAYKSCTNRILKDLKEKHKKHCPWPLTPSPENFLTMTPMAKEEALYKFLQRLRLCLNFDCSLPRIKDSVISDLGLTELHITSFCKLAEINSEDMHHLGRSVVCLAATGWALTSDRMDPKKLYVSCTSCQRSVWLKSYNLLDSDCSHESDIKLTAPFVKESRISSSTRKEGICEPPMKKKKFSFEKIDFHPIEEHRLWCLWVMENNNGKNNDNHTKGDSSVKSKDDQSSVPGWKIFLKSLLRNISPSEPPLGLAVAKRPSSGTMSFNSHPSRGNVLNKGAPS